MSARLPERKPWSMKVVILLIIGFVVPYTWITLHYRKPGPAYQPYEDGKKRANVQRLLSSGYNRITVTATRPADGSPSPVPADRRAEVNNALGGLPPSLAETLVEPPLLCTAVSQVIAPTTISALLPATITFTSQLENEKSQLAGAELYVRDDVVTIVPTFEPIPGELQARWQSGPTAITIPAGTLKPGRYQVTLVAARQSQTWQLDVQ